MIGMQHITTIFAMHDCWIGCDELFGLVYNINRAAYQSAAPIYKTCDGEYNGTCADISDSILNETFSQSYGHAGLALFVLLTTSNYPELSSNKHNLFLSLSACYNSI
jgi:hypothetical protein